MRAWRTAAYSWLLLGCQGINSEFDPDGTGADAGSGDTGAATASEEAGEADSGTGTDSAGDGDTTSGDGDGDGPTDSGDGDGDGTTMSGDGDGTGGMVGVAVLVTGSGLEGTDLDVDLADQMRGLPFSDVLVMDDDDPPILAGVEVVVLSESIVPSKLAPEYIVSSVPLVVLEGGAWDEVGLSLVQGTTTPSTDVDIVDASHPVAAGLGGIVPLLVQPGLFASDPGDLGAAASVVATDPATGQPSIYVYDAGATLADGTTAGGRRVALGTDADQSGVTVGLAVPEGRTLVAAAIAWAAGV